ncbi:hypothetical protein [Streptomyces viridochromogenes]|uniref:hypothetical protein n=1 Tax=Streptomyces viridochromogenes TaxID=1938 RepID=UPI000A69D205|nr:hypothetical protein [Streptomyces viridochromogenes]
MQLSTPTHSGLSPRHADGRPTAQRADELLTVACLLTGNTTSIQDAPRQTGTSFSRHTVSAFLTELTRRRDCAGVLRALILLAEHLDAHGSPIEYARRRALFTARPRLIDPETWLDLQKRLRAAPALDTRQAQRWIFHTISPCRTSPTAKEPASLPSASPCSRTALPCASQSPTRPNGQTPRTPADH